MSLGDTIVMLDYDDDSPEFDPVDPERIYINYLETCRRLGVKPTPRDRADKLIAEWTAAIAAGLSPPPVRH